MTTNPPARELPAPGWYRDPSSGRRRWWNGIAWTAQFEGERTDLGGVLGQPTISSSTSVNPWPIWTVVIVLPLLSTLVFLATDYRTYFSDVLVAVQLHHSVGLPPTIVLSQLAGLVTYVATVVLAYLDWRILGRRGVVRPFFWVWALLPIVYLIGRGVVLRRRVGRGMSPFVIYLAVCFILGILQGAVLTTSMLGVLTPQAGGA